jgi:hypothetical protein
MRPVGRHTGERAEEPTYADAKPPRRKILFLALLVTITLVAWGVLVYAAIDLGGDVRTGQSTSWAYLGLTTVGAAACLFVTLLLGARILALIQGRQAPARPRGGRRAAR